MAEILLDENVRLKRAVKELSILNEIAKQLTGWILQSTN